MRRARLLAVALMAALLFDPLLLRIFLEGEVAAPPWGYFYLFAAWGLVVALLWRALRSDDDA